jgi:hypothetical protein
MKTPNKTRDLSDAIASGKKAVFERCENRDNATFSAVKT